MEMIKLQLVILVGLLALIAAFMFFREYLSLVKRIHEVEMRLEKMDQAKHKRMPYEAFESILDARAALNKEKEEFQFFVSLIENAEAHLNHAMTVGTKRENEGK